MTVKKQTPKTVSLDGVVVETETLPVWQTVGDMSDDILLVQGCNITDKSGMGRRNCLMRMINAKTGDLAGVPTIMKGYIVVNGDLQGE